ncbi:MAG: hypothetical protein MUF47_05535 [Porphyrobacter sp.]|nr:hypothetical protein [Porphyrobacter sp.]
MTDSGYASLGPSLLARKGGAKPAMRPQLPVLGDAQDVARLADEQLEDLGWNDMGDEPGAGTAAVIAPIDPTAQLDPKALAANPIVRRQQRRLEERLLADAVMTGPGDIELDEAELGDVEPEDKDDAFAPSQITAEAWAEPAPVPAPESVLAVRAQRARKPASTPAAKPAAAASGRRAAFTLRLDADRHLKLRLAATMRGVSAQVLVTDALDALLVEFDELETIAARLQRR